MEAKNEASHHPNWDVWDEKDKYRMIQANGSLQLLKSSKTFQKFIMKASQRKFITSKKRRTIISKN
jgi:hypothetical protein